jgi:hypothetical protein
MTITLRQLKRLRACEEQIKLFKECFGESVVVTRALLLRNSYKFNLLWFAKKIMKGRNLNSFLHGIADRINDEPDFNRRVALSLWDIIKDK